MVERNNISPHHFSLTFRRVFIIALDGLGGYYLRNVHTPNIDRILHRGTYTYSGRTVYPSNSNEAWGSAFHGVPPQKHGIDDDHQIGENVPWPSIFKLTVDKSSNT